LKGLPERPGEKKGLAAPTESRRTISSTYKKAANPRRKKKALPYITEGLGEKASAGPNLSGKRLQIGSTKRGDWRSVCLLKNKGGKEEARI